MENAEMIAAHEAAEQARIEQATALVKKFRRLAGEWQDTGNHTDDVEFARQCDTISAAYASATKAVLEELGLGQRAQVERACS